MFAKIATVFGVFALAAQVAVATPPACLIAAVNTQDDPSDIKTVCTSGSSEVQTYLSKNCGNALDDATSAWTSYCKDAGVTVSSASASASASHTGSASSASGTASATASSGFITSSVTASASSSSGAAASSSYASGTSATATPTSTSATTTGAAARLGMDIVGLAAVGIFGAMLAM